jgi:hypothetical protein
VSDCKSSGIAERCCCCEFFCCRCEYSSHPADKPSLEYWCGRTEDAVGEYQISMQALSKEMDRLEAKNR